MKRILLSAALLALTGTALAKLPPLSDEAKAKAAEAAAKSAWAGKVDGYKLCLAQDRVAAKYRQSAAAAGQTPGAVVNTAACADPGPFVYQPPEAKPVEAAGAHSPAATAAAPPSGSQPQAEVTTGSAAATAASGAAPAATSASGAAPVASAAKP